MKKFIYTATALLVIAGASAQAVTLSSARIEGKTKTSPSQPSPTTDQIPPNCPWNDPNGCGIFN